MSRSFWFLASLALLLSVVAWWRSPGLVLEGVRRAGNSLTQIGPQFAMGLLLGGMFSVVLPREWLATYVGEKTGWVGLLLATVAGMVSVGGPVVVFPIAAAFWKMGAGVGPMVAYLSAWGLLGIQRTFVFEMPILGWRFVVLRYTVCVIAPPLLGWLCAWVERRWWSL